MDSFSCFFEVWENNTYIGLKKYQCLILSFFCVTGDVKSDKSSSSDTDIEIIFLSFLPFMGHECASQLH